MQEHSPPSLVLGACVVVARMGLGELKSHRDELPDFANEIIDDVYRVLEPMALPLSAYETAAALLLRQSDRRYGIG